MKTAKKALALLLAALLAFGSMAVGVTAGEEEALPVWEKGDTVTLGSFEQDNNTENGKEPIEWILLDPETGLCISKYGLEKMEFDDDSNDYTESEIRMWLYGNDGEGEFYKNSFTNTEKAAIKTGDIVTYGFGNVSILNDKVFLLSTEEAEQYFADDDARVCGSTAYAENGTAGNDSCWWWLRSPSFGTELSIDIRSDGSIKDDGASVFDEYGCARPAVYLDLKAEAVRTELKSGMLQAIPAQTYTGNPVEPGVTVKYGENTLGKDTDYTVSYSNNTNAGTALVTVKGIGKYRGELNLAFVINPASQNAPTGVSKTDETKCSANDGKITGVTTAMEFAFERGEYKPCKGTEITGLQPGTYSVRFAADKNHTASDAVQLIIGKGACCGGEATCSAPAKCEGCGEPYGKINPGNHAYNKVSFIWSKSYDNCNATFTCQNNAEHTETVSCKVNKVLKPEPTCTEEGLWTCTATVTFEGKEYTDVKTYSAPLKDHDWEENYTVDKEASFGEAGSESIHCKNCSATKDSRAIPSGSENFETVKEENKAGLSAFGEAHGSRYSEKVLNEAAEEIEAYEYNPDLTFEQNEQAVAEIRDAATEKVDARHNFIFGCPFLSFFATLLEPIFVFFRFI